jgi:hypothetical protein
VVLAKLFGERRSLKEWGRWHRSYSSELLGLEARRMIDRLRLQSALDDASVALAHQELSRLEKGIGYIAVSRQVLSRAALPLPTVVKTLDAIHLTSALLYAENLGERLIFATHDHQQSTAARSLGFEVIGI